MNDFKSDIVSMWVGFVPNWFSFWKKVRWTGKGNLELDEIIDGLVWID